MPENIDQQLAPLRPVYDYCLDTLANNPDSQLLIMPDKTMRGVRIEMFGWANIDDEEGPFLYFARVHGEGRPLRMSVFLERGTFKVTCYNNIGDSDRFQSVKLEFDNHKGVIEFFGKALLPHREKFVSIMSLGHPVQQEKSRADAEAEIMRQMEEDAEERGLPGGREIDDPEAEEDGMGGF